MNIHIQNASLNVVICKRHFSVHNGKSQLPSALAVFRVTVVWGECERVRKAVTAGMALRWRLTRLIAWANHYCSAFFQIDRMWTFYVLLLPRGWTNEWQWRNKVVIFLKIFKFSNQTIKKKNSQSDNSYLYTVFFLS